MQPTSSSRRRWVRLRRLGLGAALPAAALWVFSCLWHASFAYYGSWAVALTNGSFVTCSFDPPLMPPHRLGGKSVAECQTQFFRNGWAASWWPSWTTSSAPPSPLTTVILPLWIPAAAVLVVALLAHRRIQAIDLIGHCPRCRYDRAGLDDAATCPECGAAGRAPVGVRSAGA